MISTLYIVFLFFLVFILFYRSKLISKSTLLNIFFLTLLGLIIFKDGSIMPDYQVYKDNYFKIANGNFDILLEPSYILICYIFSPFGDIGFYFVLATYGITALYLHNKVFKINQRNIDFSILLYYTNFFIIFALIQIRAGVALGFIYLAILNYKSKKTYLLNMLFATFFHYSSIFFLPIIFLRKIKLNNFVMTFLLGVSYFLPIVSKKLLIFISNFIPESFISQKILIYTIEARASLFPIDLFNPFIISKIILLFILMNLRERLVRVNTDFNLLLKLYFLGIFFYISLSSFPDVSVRLSNILFFSEIILITLMINSFKPRWILNGTLILFCMFMFYYNINFNSYFNYSL